MGRLVGIILFGAGIIVAIASGAKLPVEGKEWPDTTTLWILASIVSAFGIVLWRMGDKKSIREAIAREAHSDQNPFVLLEKMQAPMAKLRADSNHLDLASMCVRVDEVLDAYVLPFAEVRRKVTEQMGMGKGSEVLVVIAYGERLLNRAWTAAADGHIGEAQIAVPDAVAAFQEAKKLADALMSTDAISST